MFEIGFPPDRPSDFEMDSLSGRMARVKGTLTGTAAAATGKIERLLRPATKIADDASDAVMEAIGDGLGTADYVASQSAAAAVNAAMAGVQAPLHLAKCCGYQLKSRNVYIPPPQKRRGKARRRADVQKGCAPLPAGSDPKKVFLRTPVAPTRGLPAAYGCLEWPPPHLADQRIINSLYSGYYFAGKFYITAPADDRWPPGALAANGEPREAGQSEER